MLKGNQEQLVHLVPNCEEKCLGKAVFPMAFLPILTCKGVQKLLPCKGCNQKLPHPRDHHSRDMTSHLLLATHNSRAEMLMLKEISIINGHHIHHLLRCHAEATVLREKASNLLPCCSCSMGPEELFAHTITLPKERCVRYFCK